MIDKLNEAQFGSVVSGYESSEITGMLNEVPTSISLPRAHYTAQTSASLSNGSGGDVYISMFNNWFNRKRTTDAAVQAGADTAAGGAVATPVSATGPSAGVAWFTTHFKEIAIVAGSAAIIAAIVKLIKVLDKSIKVRYNKVVRTLQKAQKQFVTDKDGLNMKSVMPGVGSKLGDLMSSVFTLNLFRGKNYKSTRTSNIGLIPFCDRYKEEIAKDYALAINAFNKIAASQEGNAENAENSSASTTYRSFREAILSDPMNEGMSEKQINESLTAAMALASLAVTAGKFILPKLGKDGKPVEGTEKEVQVTKESVREIAYAIVANFLDKYVDGAKLLKDAGVKTNSLADLDKSAVENLKDALKKYSKPDANSYSKMYTRLNKAYATMLNHYLNIGNGIIKNFEKYTEAKDEKHANLLVSSKEKLQNMWDAQKDMFENNFSHIVIEITSSDVYINYLNFIIEKVMPVFKSGLAGDADYVLDIYPRKDQFYLIRQTNAQSSIEGFENLKGNAAIAKVKSFDEKTKDIEFTLVGLIKGGYDVDGAIAHISDGADIDYSAFKGDEGKREVKLPYGKWVSLDPNIMDWMPMTESKAYMRVREVGDTKYFEYLYGTASQEATKESRAADYDHIVFASYDMTKHELVRLDDIKLSSPLTEDELKSIVTNTAEGDSNMGFGEVTDDAQSKELISKIRRSEKNVAEAGNNDALIKVINGTESAEANLKTPIYGKDDIDIGGVKYVAYAYAVLPESTESENSEGLEHLNDNTINEDGENDAKDVDKAQDGKPDTNDEETVEKILVVIDKADESGKPSPFTDKVTYPVEVSVNKCSLNSVAKAFEAAGFKKLSSSITKDQAAFIDKNKKGDIIKYVKNIDEFEGFLNEIYEAIKKLQEPAPLTDEQKVELSNKAIDAIFSEGVIALEVLDNGPEKRWVVKKEVAESENKGFAIKAVTESNDSKYTNQPLIKIINVGEFYLRWVGNKDGKDVTDITIADGRGEHYSFQGADANALKTIVANIILKKVSPSNDEQKQSEQPNVQADQNSGEQQEQKEEGIKINYKESEVVSEGVNITRSIDKYISKDWAIISESVYDDGAGHSAKIDSNKFRTYNITNKTDVMKYIKENENARISHKSDETYTITNKFGYVPSIATPLYESVMLVKFDKNDNVETKIYLGKTKIK